MENRREDNTLRQFDTQLQAEGIVLLGGISESMKSVLNDFIKNYPGRKSQIELLYNLFGYEEEPFVNAIYIYGGPSTGKTFIMSSLLERLNVAHASVNLIECYTSRILFETILNKLSGHKMHFNNPEPFAKCDNMMEFVNNLKKFSRQFGWNKAVIVLDKAEHLQNMDFNLLSCFLRMREITALNICVVFISELAFQKYYNKGNIVEPIKLHFQQYTKDEIFHILSLDFEETSSNGLDITLDFYQNYLNVFLSVFYRACRDLSELRYMSRINFVKYCEPVLRQECSMSDSMSLWRHISPILKSSLEVLYLRLPIANQPKKVDISDVQKQFTFSKENLAQSLELPFYAKYLLIAAYLASYNPAKDDKRIFMKHHGKKRKTQKDIKAKNKVSEQLNTQLGPKPFSFDRLLAIFYAILDDKVGFNNNLLVQVSSLVELQLLSALSDHFNLDGQKYKCMVSFDFIQTIAKMVGFNIRKYLSDFNYM